MPARRQVDDRQTQVAEPARTVDQHTFIVGTTVTKHVAHPSNLALCHVRVAADRGEIGMAKVLGKEPGVAGLLP